MRSRTGEDVRTTSVSAIVLAAGRATRMGRQKVLLPLGDRSLVERAVDAALGSRVNETIVVVGHEGGSVRETLGGRPVIVVENLDYAQGMSTSLQAGIRALASDCDAAIFLLGDQPFITSDLVDRLIDRFAETGAWIVRPVVESRPIHPVLMSAGLFPEVLEQRGDIGGREIARRHPEQQCLVPVGEGWTGLDIDTGDDYEAALRTTARLSDLTRGA